MWDPLGCSLMGRVTLMGCSIGRETPIEITRVSVKPTPSFCFIFVTSTYASKILIASNVATKAKVSSQLEATHDLTLKDH